MFPQEGHIWLISADQSLCGPLLTQSFLLSPKFCTFHQRCGMDTRSVEQFWMIWPKLEAESSKGIMKSSSFSNIGGLKRKGPRFAEEGKKFEGSVNMSERKRWTHNSQKNRETFKLNTVNTSHLKKNVICFEIA